MAANVNTARNTALPPSPGTMTQGPAGVTPPGGHYPAGQTLVPQGKAARVVDGRALATTSDMGRGQSTGPTNMARDPHTIYQGTNTSGKFDVATRPGVAPSDVTDVVAKDVTKPAVSGPPKPPSGYRGGYDAGQKTMKALRGAAAPLAAIAGGMELADGIDQGDKRKMFWGGLDTAAGIGLATGYGTVPAAAYLGARGVYEGAKAAAGYFGQDPNNAGRDAVAPSVPKKPLTAGGTAQASSERDLDAENAAKLAAGGFDLAKHNAPGEIGQKRNTDREGNMLPEGQAQQWTGPKMGWQGGVSSDEQLRKNTLRDEKFTADRKAAAEEATNGAHGYRTQLRNMQEMNADTLRQQVARGEITDPRAREAILADAQQRNTLRGQESQSAAHVRSAQIGADAQRYSADSSARSAAAMGRMTQFNADRTDARESDKWRQEKERNAASDTEKMFSGAFMRTNDKGQPEEDTGKRSQAIFEFNRATEGGKNLGGRTKSQAQGDALDYVNILSSARDHQNNSLWQKYGWGDKDPAHSGLPPASAMRKATVTRVGPWEGGTTVGVGKGDYAINIPGHPPMYVGSDVMGKQQLAYLKSMGANLDGTK